jgi:hypothetical protein
MSCEAEQRASALLALKMGNRQQLEAMAARYDEMRARRDALVAEVEVLQKEVEAKTLSGQQESPPASSKPAAPANGGNGHRRRWSGTVAPDDAELTTLGGMTLTDEQIADALSNLLDFSATRSNIRSSDK